MTTFAERLRKLREEAGLTQVQLAEILHVDPATISTYETKEDRSPSLSLLQAIADLFGVSTDYLLGRNDFRRGIPDPLETEWPEFISLLRRARGRITPEEKKFLAKLVKSYLAEDERERRKKG